MMFRTVTVLNIIFLFRTVTVLNIIFLGINIRNLKSEQQYKTFYMAMAIATIVTSHGKTYTNGYPF